MEIFKYLKNIKADFFPGESNFGLGVGDVLIRSLLKIGFLSLMICFTSNRAIAQNGVVVGKVFDTHTAEPVEGAEVTLNNTRYRANSDAGGRFVIRKVPIGDYTLVVSVFGYNRYNTSITVSSNEYITQNVGIEEKLLEEDALYFTKGKTETARALNMQHKSDGERTIVTNNQMDLFGDYTVQDALARISGVQVNHLGEVNIRGVGLNNYNVTIDGRKMSTTGMGGRSFDLGSISIDMINNLEVIKVITPDMRADALAGNVNLVTRRPAGEDLQLGGLMGGGATPRYFSYTGLESRAMLNYSQKLSNNVFVALDLSQQMDNRGWESLRRDYNVVDFGNGPVDVLERITPSLHTFERSKLGGRLQLNYQPSEFTSIYVQGFLSSDEQISDRHRTIWDTGGDWMRFDTTSTQAGSHVYDALHKDSNVNNFSLQAGASHNFKSIDLSYYVTWSQSRISQSEYLFPFMIERLNYSIDMEDRTRPSMQVTNIPVFEDGVMDPRRYISQPFGRVINNHVDNTFSGDIDVIIPIRYGSLKMGSSADLTYKSGDFSDTNLGLRRGIPLFYFSLIRRGDFDPLNFYHIPYIINTDLARNFVRNNRPDFTKNLDLEHERSDIWNYQVNEQIYSGYAMTTLKMNRVTLLAGARLEHTLSSNEGNNVFINDDGSHLSTTTELHDNNYTHILPNAQLVLAPGRRLNVRLAWTQSIARPDFNLITPFEIVNARDSLIFHGNPNLDPVTSNNLDLIFEYYYQNTGVISMNLFHKNLSGFIIERQRILSDGEFSGWHERTYINSDEKASVYGVELSWQQNLDFLPGFLRNLSTYANYTWTDSAYKVDYREDEVPLPGQSPHVVNAALQYTQGRVIAQVAYHWTATALGRLQENPVLLPSINSTQPIYADSYQDGWKDLSATLRIQISRNFRFWVDVSNLLHVERTQYDHTRELYPRETILRGGSKFRAGIRMNL